MHDKLQCSFLYQANLQVGIVEYHLFSNISCLKEILVFVVFLQDSMHFVKAFLLIES